METTVKTTDPSAPTEGVHQTPEESAAKLEKEIAEYRANKTPPVASSPTTAAKKVEPEPTKSSR